MLYASRITVLSEMPDISFDEQDWAIAPDEKNRRKTGAI